MKTENALALAYYAGNFSLACLPTPGSWDGDTFTAFDGSKWVVDADDASPHPSTDGSGMHYLLPAPTFTLTASNGESDAGFILTHDESGISISSPCGRSYRMPQARADKAEILSALVAKWAEIDFPPLPARKWVGDGYSSSRSYAV
jgi:hypothetical protein